MARYVSSTVAEFTTMPCAHGSDHMELAEHPEGLEIVCTECGARTWIPKRCKCGLTVAQAKTPHEEGWKPAIAFPRIPQSPNALRSLENAIRASGGTVVITAAEVLAGQMREKE